MIGGYIMKFYDFTAKKMNGMEVKMDDYKGKVVLVVNTASKCGLTPQLNELEQMYKDYKDKGFEILGFPCNQFANQDPGSNKEISEFCLINYGVTFTMFEKIDVNRYPTGAGSSCCIRSLFCECVYFGIFLSDQSGVALHFWMVLDADPLALFEVRPGI
jgi:hypothetical protein